MFTRAASRGDHSGEKNTRCSEEKSEHGAILQLITFHPLQCEDVEEALIKCESEVRELSLCTVFMSTCI